MITLAHTPGARAMTVTFATAEPDPLAEVVLDIDFLLHPAWPDIDHLILRPDPADRAHRSVTLDLPADIEVSYRFLRRTATGPTIPETFRGGPPDPTSLDALRGLCASGRPDPDSTRRIAGAFGSDVTSSVLVGPAASPGHRVWDPTAPASPVTVSTLRAGRLDDASPATAARLDAAPSDRRVTVVSSDTARVTRLVVLLDGDVWVDSLDLPAAIARWDQPETAFAIVATPDRERLPDRAHMTAMIIGTVIPTVEDHLGVRFAASHVTIVGHSYSGLAAAGLACDHPQRIGSAIVGSGSFWHRDSHDVRDDDSPGDLTEELTADTPLEQSRFVLQVGREEGGMVDQTRMFAEAAARTGADVDVRVYPGGHDYAWYRHALFDGLDVLIGHR